MPQSENKSSSNQWGTIFMSGGETSLISVEKNVSTAWTPEDEVEYLARVKCKVVVQTEKMLKAAKAEAEDIQKNAYEEAYDKGMEDARKELEEFRAGMAGSVAAVLSSIEGQCSQIFDNWREDLIGITRLAVEKVTGMVLSEERVKILEGILDQTVALLEERREITIRVNPEDEPVIADLMQIIQNKFADIKSWCVRADTTIAPGGMVVESSSSLADGRVESRKAAVEQIISCLTLSAE